MGRMKMIIEEAENRLSGINKSYGLVPSGRSNVVYTSPTTGNALEPVTPADVSNALNEAGQGFIDPKSTGGGW